MQGPGSPVQMLGAMVGADVLSSDPADLAPFLTDHRRLFQGKALALARPRTLQQVAQILGFCNSQHIAVVPVGGNTSYCGGATPDASGRQLLLSVARLNRIRAVDPLNYSMTAEAGCILQHVSQAAAEVDRLFPLSLGAEGSCQLGGNLATNAGGLNVLRYGMTRDLVLGLEVVLADGRILSNLTALRKDNTGYDLKSLFIGSEGTLGVITAASLKLFPLPHSLSTAWAAVANPAAAVELLSLLRDHCGDAVQSFELIPRTALQLVTTHIASTRNPLAGDHDWQVLIELGAANKNAPIEQQLLDALQLGTERGLISEAVIANNERQRAAFWRLRETIPEAQRQESASLKHDVSLPLTSLAEFIAIASSQVEKLAPEGFLVAYGHVGDGNLHFNVSQRRGTNLAAFLAREPILKRAIYDLVHTRGGSFSAEHGIGQLRVGELEHYASPVKLALMRAIKQSLDPQGIMNPGKVLRG